MTIYIVVYTSSGVVWSSARAFVNHAEAVAYAEDFVRDRAATTFEVQTCWLEKGES